MLEGTRSEKTLVARLHRLWLAKKENNNHPNTCRGNIREALGVVRFINKKASAADDNLLRELALHYSDPKEEELISQLTSLNRNQKNVLAQALDVDLQNIKEKLFLLQIVLKDQEQALRQKNMTTWSELVSKEAPIISDLQNLVKAEGEVAKNIENSIRLVKELEANALFVSFLRGLTKWYVARNFIISVKGGENIPEHGPVMIAPRHYHGHYDHIIYYALIHRRINILAATDVITGKLKKKLIRLMYKFQGTIPISRRRNGDNGNGAESLSMVTKKIIAQLKLNQAILMFPEGRPVISYSGKVNGDKDSVGEIKDGIFRFVIQAQQQSEKDIPIVPIGSTYGTIEPMKYGKMARKTLVFITFGKPIIVPRNTNKSELQPFCRKLHRELTELSNTKHQRN